MRIAVVLSYADPNVSPMGQRFRLKAGFDTSEFSPEVQVILRAMKTYGIILADNGSDWYITGAPNSLWDDEVLRELRQVFGGDFEAVDVSSLMLDPDSGKASQFAGEGEGEGEGDGGGEGEGEGEGDGAIDVSGCSALRRGELSRLWIDFCVVLFSAAAMALMADVKSARRESRSKLF